MTKEQLDEFLGIAIGEASTLMTGSNVFDSARAIAIRNRIVSVVYPLTRMHELETKIIGLMDAQRSLLNEWSKLNAEHNPSDE